MNIKRTSAAPSRLSKREAKRKTTPPGESIVRGLEEAAAHFRGEKQLRTRVIRVPDEVDVRALRERSGLSQFQFAERYGFNPRTMQDWEQGRAKPDTAVRAYLTVIKLNPDAVEKALA
jgi:putative transcriptional regulator